MPSNREENSVMVVKERDIEEHYLRNYFGMYGKIETIQVMKDRRKKWKKERMSFYKF